MLEIIAALSGFLGIVVSLLAWPAALGILIWTVLRRRHALRKALAICALIVVPFVIGNASGNLWSLGTDHPEYYIPAESSIFTFRALEGSGGSGQWWSYGRDRTHVYFNNQDGTYVVSPLSSASRCAGFRETNLETWCVRRQGKRRGLWL
jgi:hypothetical protein